MHFRSVRQVRFELSRGCTAPRSCTRQITSTPCRRSWREYRRGGSWIRCRPSQVMLQAVSLDIAICVARGSCLQCDFFNGTRSVPTSRRHRHAQFVCNRVMTCVCHEWHCRCSIFVLLYLSGDTNLRGTTVSRPSRGSIMQGTRSTAGCTGCCGRRCTFDLASHGVAESPSKQVDKVEFWVKIVTWPAVMFLDEATSGVQ